MLIQRSNRELWASFIAIILITIAYLFMLVWLDGIPRASDFYGHTIGILGFVLMLMTESLYSLRKRSRSARWGRMSEWLNFHIFTGLVGPYMVLLHSSWKFNGLAGITLLLTVIIVLSGFVGRYIYTAVPRSVDGAEMGASSLEDEIAATDQELQRWLSAQSDRRTLKLAQRLSALSEVSGAGAGIIFGRALSDLRFRLAWQREKGRLGPEVHGQMSQLEGLFKRRRQLRRQVASLAMARRMLALWHAVHIPIGMVLFTAAFIHIVAAVYYATLLR